MQCYISQININIYLYYLCVILINLMRDPWFNSQIGSWREGLHRCWKTEGLVPCDSIELDSIGLWFGFCRVCGVNFACMRVVSFIEHWFCFVVVLVAMSLVSLDIFSLCICLFIRLVVSSASVVLRLLKLFEIGEFCISSFHFLSRGPVRLIFLLQWRNGREKR